MISLQMLLAEESQNKLVLFLALVVILLVVCVFISGMKKGLIRAGKSGIFWLLSGAGFIALHELVPNPLATEGGEGFMAENNGVVWAMLLLVATVVVVMLVRSIFAKIFAPRKKSPKTIMVSREGLEYEVDDTAEANGLRPISKYESVRENSPGILSGVLGGFVETLNMLIMVALLAVVGVTLAISADGMVELVGEDFGEFFNVYARPYVWDLLMVGLLLWIAYKGFYTGTIGFTRILFVKIGVLAVVVLGFALPFIPAFCEANEELMQSCTDLFAKVEFLPPEILGKLVLGVVFVVIGCLSIVLINLALKALMEFIENTCVLRVIDGLLAIVIYLFLGVLICALVWGGLYLLSACGIFNVQDTLSANTLAYEFFKTMEYFLADFAGEYLLKYAA